MRRLKVASEMHPCRMVWILQFLNEVGDAGGMRMDRFLPETMKILKEKEMCQESLR